jgi:cytochrome oxidase Cu insertion factor (SCO1/SenC/PrrC family)
MSKRYLPLVLAIAIAAATAGVFIAKALKQPAVAQLESGTALPTPGELAPFNLVDTRGAPVTPAELRGQPTLVFFGFTNCPDVCPTTLALLTQVQKKVALPGSDLASLKVALISVDPERDTPEQMGKYLASFGGDLIGLTGTAPEIVRPSAASALLPRAWIWRVAATRWTIRPRCSCSMPRAARSRCSRHRCVRKHWVAISRSWLQRCERARE